MPRINTAKFVSFVKSTRFLGTIGKSECYHCIRKFYRGDKTLGFLDSSDFCVNLVKSRGFFVSAKHIQFSKS
ncbi:MAG: hypothetical protein EMLJLAPB_00588 [Candidatus Argoarchaeum ethanivorans]|uniref:Uncharacterized protein n=1 Tax=Candidatus Argoarchaeum ethanivorans TaxID=2608793 RepID=A0A811TBD0_9EURY|nr:MAG: hypothetical protein EMLJLAPB_00588 [Candidatus Argoarchaeum ethanivorans]